MKSRSLIIALLLTASCMKSEYEVQEDFFRTVELARRGGENYRNALEVFSQYDASSEMYPAALYNVGHLHFLLGEDERAINVFHQILQSDFIDVNNGEADDGLIDASYTMNSKHRASNTLSRIYFSQKRFDSALYYYSISDTLYPFGATCCDQLSDRRIDRALRYADIYERLDRNDMAIRSLLDPIFPMRTDNSQVIGRLRELLTSEPSPASIKSELDSALWNIYTTTRSDTNGNVWTFYHFRFRGEQVDIPDSYGYRYAESDMLDARPTPLNDRFDAEVARATIRETPFYQMVCEL